MTVGEKLRLIAVHETGVTVEDLAAQFKVAKRTVFRILGNKRSLKNFSEKNRSNNKLKSMRRPKFVWLLLYIIISVTVYDKFEFLALKKPQ